MTSLQTSGVYRLPPAEARSGASARLKMTPLNSARGPGEQTTHPLLKSLDADTASDR